MATIGTSNQKWVGLTDFEPDMSHCHESRLIRVGKHLCLFVAGVVAWITLVLSNQLDSATSSSRLVLVTLTLLLLLGSLHTWEEVLKCNLPKGSKLVGSWWIFDLKYNSDSTVEWYKVHLAAQGFTQVADHITKKLIHLSVLIKLFETYLPWPQSMTWKFSRLTLLQLFWMLTSMNWYTWGCPQAIRWIQTMRWYWSYWNQYMGSNKHPMSTTRSWQHNLRKCVSNQWLLKSLSLWHTMALCWQSTHLPWG